MRRNPRRSTPRIGARPGGRDPPEEPGGVRIRGGGRAAFLVEQTRGHEPIAPVGCALACDRQRRELRPDAVRSLQRELGVRLLQQVAVGGGEERERQHAKQHLTLRVTERVEKARRLPHAIHRHLNELRPPALHARQRRQQLGRPVPARARRCAALHDAPAAVATAHVGPNGGLGFAREQVAPSAAKGEPTRGGAEHQQRWVEGAPLGKATSEERVLRRRGGSEGEMYSY